MITKKILFGILMAFATAEMTGAAQTVSIPTADIEGSKDSPLLKRYAGSLIIAYERKGFDEFTIPLSKVEKGELKGRYLQYAPKEKKTIEGPYTRLVYLIPVDRSPLEIIRNYQDDIINQGGKVLYECKREECGGDAQKSIVPTVPVGHTVDLSLASFLRPYDRLGLEKFSQGYCATTSNIMDQRYLAAELPDGSAYFSIHTYIFKDRYYNNCDAFKGRTIVVVDIVEGKPREKNMVVVEASDMAKQISTTGSVSLYGIFFDTNEFSVREDSEATLKEITKLAQQQPDLNLLVVGHTDNAGTFEYNMSLSQNRAQSVVDELSAKHGISQERLVPVGVSYASPVSSNATAEGQALNRRVELVENRAQ